MLMIWRGDHHKIDAGLRQQIVIIYVRLGVLGRFREGALPGGLVDIAYRHALGPQLLKRLMQPAAAIAYADDAERGTVVRSTRRTRNEQRRRGQALQKGSAIGFHTP